MNTYSWLKSCSVFHVFQISPVYAGLFREIDKSSLNVYGGLKVKVYISEHKIVLHYKKKNSSTSQLKKNSNFM